MRKPYRSIYYDEIFVGDVLINLSLIEKSVIPARLHLYGLLARELVSNMLREIPEDIITSACWFKPPTPTNNPPATSQPSMTRYDRVRYFLFSNLSDQFLKEHHASYQSDIRGYIKLMDKLSGLVHFDAQTLNTSPTDNDFKPIQDALKELVNFSDKISDSLEMGILTYLQDQVFDPISDVLSEISHIASHVWIDDFNIETLKLTGFDDEGFNYSFFGNLELGTQYGSSSDIREDRGALWQENLMVSGRLFVPRDSIEESSEYHITEVGIAEPAWMSEQDNF